MIVCVSPEIVDFFFVDTTPLVESYWTNPEYHHYDWREVAPRENYIPNLLKVWYIGKLLQPYISMKFFC